MVPVKGQAGLAILVVLAIAAIGLLIIIVSAVSQDNAPTTVDGKQAVHSQDISGS
jgi:competence protein ComGC